MVWWIIGAVFVVFSVLIVMFSMGANSLSEPERPWEKNKVVKFRKDR